VLGRVCPRGSRKDAAPISTAGDCCPETMMQKEKLIEILRKLLDTEEIFDFLQKLTETELETLVASVRGRIDRER
jgi:uncharacterized protein YecA (UPF0149 family)